MNYPKSKNIIKKKDIYIYISLSLSTKYLQNSLLEERLCQECMERALMDRQDKEVRQTSIHNFTVSLKK